MLEVWLSQGCATLALGYFCTVPPGRARNLFAELVEGEVQVEDVDAGFAEEA